MVTVVVAGMIAAVVNGMVDTLTEFPVQTVVDPITMLWRRKDLSAPVK